MAIKATTLVDSVDLIKNLVDRISKLPADASILYIDLEGVNLSRNGSISIMTILPAQSDTIYLVDITKLQRAAFEIQGQDGRAFKGILESTNTTKVFFDKRNDSDALYTHYQIRLQGVEDVQLMENGSRDGAIWRKRLKTLGGRPEEGKESFRPERGGRYQVFNSRPLSADIASYCAHRVTFLPELRNKYWGKLNEEWKVKVGVETRARVASSQSTDYQPDGQHKVLGPWN